MTRDKARTVWSVALMLAVIGGGIVGLTVHLRKRPATMPVPPPVLVAKVGDTGITLSDAWPGPRGRSPCLPAIRRYG